MRSFAFFSSRRRHTRYWRDWSSDVCSSDLEAALERLPELGVDREPVRDAEQLPVQLAEPVGRDRGHDLDAVRARDVRSEERRVGKECRSRWSPYHYKKNDEHVPRYELSGIV